jgi:hypothetical protein
MEVYPIDPADRSARRTLRLGLAAGALSGLAAAACRWSRIAATVGDAADSHSCKLAWTYVGLSVSVSMGSQTPRHSARHAQLGSPRGCDGSPYR